MGGGSYRLKSIRKVALIFLLIITLISVILINKSEAKYQVGKTYEDIVSGNVKNNIADFNLVSIYINGEKSKDNQVPINGYLLDLEKTKCMVNNVELSDITFEYKYGKVGVFGINASKTKCNIYFIDSPTKKIIDSSLGKLDNIHFSYTSCKDGTNNETHTEGNCQEETNGVYEEETNLGKTYYYRGSVNNNWVKFGTNKEGIPMWWRIIRINEDGTIRLIYSGTGENKPLSSDEEGYWVINDNSSIGNYMFNGYNNYNAYVGYMYGTPNSETFNAEHGYDLIDQNRQDELHSSDIKNAIDARYQENMLEETNYLSGSTGFCGDRTPAEYKPDGYTNKGYGVEVTFYKAYDRILYSESYYQCPDSKHDLYTTKTDRGEGNGALTYPIGLITIEDVIHTGTAWFVSNYGSWLYDENGFSTVTPYAYHYGYAHMFSIGLYGQADNCNTWVVAPVRPVINLKPEYFKTENRDGTINNPYIVES